MDRKKLRQRLRAIFLTEFEEHLAALRRDLAVLEEAPEKLNDGDLIVTLHRTAHSLKGASRSAGVPLVQSAGYAMERIFAALRDGAREPNPGLFQLLFTATDAMDEARQRLTDERDLSGGPIEVLLPKLEAAAPQAR